MKGWWAKAEASLGPLRHQPCSHTQRNPQLPGEVDTTTCSPARLRRNTRREASGGAAAPQEKSDRCAPLRDPPPRRCSELARRTRAPTPQGALGTKHGADPGSRGTTVNWPNSTEAGTDPSLRLPGDTSPAHCSGGPTSTATAGALGQPHCHAPAEPRHGGTAPRRQGPRTHEAATRWHSRPGDKGIHTHTYMHRNSVAPEPCSPRALRNAAADATLHIQATERVPSHPWPPTATHRHRPDLGPSLAGCHWAMAALTRPT